MLYSTWIFTCDAFSCFFKQDIPSGLSGARDLGWAISRDRKHCYCPEHAKLYRNVGRFGRPRCWTKAKEDALNGRKFL